MNPTTIAAPGVSVEAQVDELMSLAWLMARDTQRTHTDAALNAVNALESALRAALLAGAASGEPAGTSSTPVYVADVDLSNKRALEEAPKTIARLMAVQPPSPVGVPQGVTDEEVTEAYKLLSEVIHIDCRLSHVQAVVRRTLEGFAASRQVTGALPASDDLRQQLGEALTEVLTDEDAAPEPDWFDSREIDRVIDAIMPILAATPAGAVPVEPAFHLRQFGDVTSAQMDEYLQTGQIDQTDPMDTPLPCDVTVGHGTMRKGVALRSLVLRMKALYEMATGNNADEVAGRSIEERNALFEKSPFNLMNYEVGGRFVQKLSPEAQAIADQLDQRLPSAAIPLSGGVQGDAARRRS